MAVEFIAEGTVANVASGNVTPGAPAGTQEGDLLIACIAYRDTAAFTNPTGGEWTTIATQQSSGNTSTTASTAIASGHMAYCIRGASDPNFTFTRTGGNVARAMVFAFRGVDTSTPLDNADAVTEASNTSTPTVSGWTPSNAGNLYVQFCAGADNVLSSGWTQSGGSGFSSWTEQEDSNTTTGADTNLSVAWATSTSTTAITNFSLTKAASSRHVLFAAGFNAAVPQLAVDHVTVTITEYDFGISAAEATFTQDSVDYLLRDKFSSDVNPLVDANASEGSGVGYRDVTGTGMYAADGRLRGGGASTNLCYKTASGGGGWQRVGGRTFTAIVSPWDGDLDDLYFHLAETAGGIDGYGLRIVGGSSIYAYEPDGTTTLLLLEADNPIKAVRYQIGITLNEGEGAVYWIAAMQTYSFAGTEWDVPAATTARILFVSQVGTANEYFPTIRNDAGTSGIAAWEDVRLLDISAWSGADGLAIVADRFDRADSTNDNASWGAVDGSATFGISSNKAYLVTSGGAQNQATLNASTDDNVILVVKQTTGSSSVGNSGVVMNRVSGVQEMNLAPYNDSTIRMDSIDSGGYTTIATGGPYLSTSQTLRWVVMRQGNEYRYWVTGGSSQDIVNPTTDSRQDLTGTYYGISTYAGPDAGVTWDSIAVYPLTFTLPTALQTTELDTPTVGSNLETKAFTDTNGTALTTHDAEWTVGAGTWTIQSNRASVSGSGDLYAYLSAGQADYQVTVDVIAGTLGDLRAGLILRRADANNMMRVRLFVDTAQADNDEIEIETVISGSATVVEKCYLNNYFASAGTYELKCQVEGDVLYVYLDSVLHLVYYIPSTLLTGQGVGLYREGTVDDGATFDDFIVDAIGAGTQSVAMDHVTVTITEQEFGITAGAVSLAMDAASVTVTAQEFGISPSVSLAMGAASVTVTAYEFGITAGAVSLAMDAASVVVTPREFGIVPVVSLGMDAASVGITAHEFGVSASVSLAVDAASVSITGQEFGVTPGAVSLAADHAAVSITAQDFGISVTGGAQSVAFDAGAVGLTGYDFGVTPGAVSVAMDAGAVGVTAFEFGITQSQQIAVDAASVTITGYDFGLTVGAASVPFDLGAVTVTGYGFGVAPGAMSIAIDAASVTITPYAIGITTAVGPITAAFSIARAATAGLTVTAAAGAGVSIEAEDVAALAITLAAGGTIETDEAASAALEFTP